ncbi:MAG: bifunctional folylpolyglutamate synthase/dihydrofolate synthase [Eggerthellaceae bacterium]|nr:bifunctional folylpolyglutamate synthase/dihydrofolate synthase [Eggerthellaceae bacterium]
MAEQSATPPFFTNTACPHFPCHEGVDPERFNCLFCFCPLYALGENCGGAFTYLEGGIKDCSNCTLPHEGNGGNKMVEQHWSEIAELAAPDDFDAVAYINTPRWNKSVLGLERISELLEGLGNPQDKLRFVHVAGTNGKGSTCAYLSSVLTQAGYKTGLFTSPYIECFEERIRVNGENISAVDLRTATLAVKQVADRMENHPTEFELMCAVALVHFVNIGVDIAVMEVGLGGRFDATNVIKKPEVCVITRIGLDHIELLGDTTAKIAREKAGIIKNGAPVVSWPQDPDAQREIADIAAEHGCTLATTDFSQLTVEPLIIDPESAEAPMRSFSYRGASYKTRLIGSYQPSNATLALEAIEVLKTRGWNISDEAIFKGIAETRWPGRFEVVAQQPLTIVDGGHNPQGAQALADTLKEVLPDIQPVFIIGVLADKDYPIMLDEVVPFGSAFVTITPTSPRALSAEDLAEAIRVRISEEKLASTPVQAAASMEEAVAEARKLCSDTNEVICAFGSLYSIGALKAALR